MAGFTPFGLNRDDGCQAAATGDSVYIAGLYNVYSVHQHWPAPGPVRVVFSGEPLRFRANTDLESATETIEKTVRQLAE